MAGQLTTHVLDTAQGYPAVGIEVTLFRLEEGGEERTMLTQATTNPDGRLDKPLLTGDDMQPGTYELLFGVSDYFKTQPVTLPEQPFLAQVPVRFCIADPQAHYHVPLLVSPWAYSTYR